MARKRVKLLDVGKAIQDILKEYEEDISEDVNRLVPEVARDAVEELQEKAPKMTGDYAGSWTFEVERKNRTVNATIYANQYQLPHLLEFDHAKRGGGRYKADKTRHIAPVEKDLVENFENKLREVLRK